MKTLSSIYLLCLLGVVTLLGGCAPDAVDSTGRPINMADYRGKWVVITYWATWCTPCIQSIPEFNKLATYYKDKVVVLGVNVDNLDNAALQDLASGYQVSYPFLGSFPIEKWGGKPQTVPVTYIFSPKGKLYQTLVGPLKLKNFQAILGLPDVTYE